MLSIKTIGKRLLKRNYILTISCLVSVFVGTMLIIEMFNLALSAIQTYEINMQALYGDCDVAAYYSDYSSIDDQIVNEVVNIDAVCQAATLIYASDIRINDTTVYSIGTDNSSIVRSRYHFTSELTDKQVAINKVFASVYGYKVGDCLNVGKHNLNIVEIFDDNTLSPSSIEMMVVNKNTLKEISTDIGNTNIIMLQIDNLEDSHIESTIKSIDSNLNILIFGTDEAYFSEVNSFKNFVIVVAICVLFVTCLFTATVFKNFVYRYRRDMAVLRMMGATPQQINFIFKHMIKSLTAGGVAIGFFGAFLFNRLFVMQFNEKMNLIEGEVKFLYTQSLVVAITIYIVIRVILQLIINHSNKILPIEVVRSNETSMSGKIKHKKHMKLYILRRDFYISVKLIKSRLKDNYLMIATIAMLVAISMLGASLSSIIKANGERYYKDTYLAEMVLTSSNPMTYSEGEKLYVSLSEDKNIKVSCIYSASYCAKTKDTSLRYGLTDINALARQGIITPGIYEGNSIVLSRSYADLLGCSVGDCVQILSPKVYTYGENGVPLDIVARDEKEFTFKVVFIMPDEKMQDSDVYLDISQSYFINDSVWFCNMYIDGEVDYITNKLSEMKGSFSTLKWANYTDAININNEKINSRFYLLDIVTKILVFIASIGWINSLKNILISRTRDYDIIRMQGVRSERVVKIMIYQVIIYILIGLSVGILVGISILEMLMYMEQGRFTFEFNLVVVEEMLCTMLFFCMMLIPTIKRISTKKILAES